MGDLDRLTDGLTYRDLAGRRHLRRYVLAATVIFSLVSGIVYWGWRQRGQLLALGVGTPTVAITARHLVEESPAPTAAGVALAETQPSSKNMPPAEPSSTAIPSTQPLADAKHPLKQNEVLPATPEACPLDPNEWELLEIAQSDNFKRIDPPCVYDGLARTVAWHLLSHMGYSKSEAAKMLGFSDIPWHPDMEITGMTNQMGPMTISLVWEWPAHPDYHYWIVADDGRSWITYALRGCYSTATNNGGRVENWGVEYSVVCVLTLDYAPARWSVHALQEHNFSFDGTKESGKRIFVQYGYTSGGNWVLIGQQEQPQVAFDDVVQMQKDREFITNLLGVLPWDASWVEARFGIDMRPLPEGWKTFTDEAEMRAISDELNVFIQQSNGP